MCFRSTKWCRKNLKIYDELFDYFDDHNGCKFHFFEEQPSSFLETIAVEFEAHMLPTTKEWDYYLTSLYGNYMEVPPEDKRVQHGMFAYFKDEE